jgi:DNA-binding NarL/FixJ family response regulator
MKKIIHIGIADDHKLLRQGIISLLSEYENLNVIVDVSNGKELMEALKKSKPSVILLDIEMPVMNGKEALEKIIAKYPEVKVIMMSMHFNDSYIIEFIQNGARGFLPKNCDIDKIVDAIHAVHEVGYYYDNKVSAAMANMLKTVPKVVNAINDTEFTARELQILKMILHKKTNQEISEDLTLSIRTVEGHRLNISKKSNTNNSDDLISFIKKHRIL